MGKRGPPIEHFRPKQGADRGDPFTRTHLIDRDRYWWLAWNWNNLLLGCSTCNSSSFKGNWFPLAPGSLEIQVPDGIIREDHPCFAVGLEQPLLLDPASDDPLDHMTWRPLNPNSPNGPWRAFHKTERGRITIHVLGLDGRNVDRVGDHIRHVVKPWSDRVTAALEQEELVRAREIWMDALVHLFVPSQPFHAATHDALAYMVPADRRERAGLSLQRPGSRPQSHGTPPHTTLSELMTRMDASGLPEEIIRHLLARERSTPELISMICHAKPSTPDELATLLEIRVETVKKYCAQLASEGELAIDASGRYSGTNQLSPETQ